ncbi:hypothetical protein GQ600_24481 [Phytophthora cactorum]|nr:hypothetical protein GQ600_24481 [Phytophthora cactorum]
MNRLHLMTNNKEMLRPKASLGVAGDCPLDYGHLYVRREIDELRWTIILENLGSRIAGFNFATTTGASLKLRSNYICVVAVRQPLSATAANAILPWNVVWESQITRDEFMVGCGAMVSRRPRARIDEHLAFVHAAGSGTTEDFSPEPITVISEFGRVLDVSPQVYVRKYIGPNAYSTLRLDDDEDSDSDFPADIPATSFSRGRPLPRGSSDIVCISNPPQLVAPVPAAWLSGSVPPAPAVSIAGLLNEQGTSHEP